MNPAVDPFTPLLNLVQRYKRDVHRLSDPASEDDLRSAEAHLGTLLPLELKGFLRRWNGGDLFRGALHLRAAHELASPSEERRELVVVADGPGPRRWAFARDGQGGTVFGELVEDRLEPLHDRYHRWLFGTLRILDQDLRQDEDALMARLEVDPDAGPLLLMRGERALASGDPETARSCYQKATAADPGLVRPWQRLGELHLVDGDRAQGRFALMKALRATRLPTAYPGLATIEAGVLRTLGGLFPDGDETWERELSSFLEERVLDVRSEGGLELYRAAAVERVRVVLARGDRSAASTSCVEALERAKAFALRRAAELADLRLLHVRLLTQLGRHDAAERELRTLRDHDQPEVRGRALVALGRIVVARQERWGESVLTEALSLPLDDRDACEARILLAARLVALARLDEAGELLSQADALAVRSHLSVLQGEVCLALGDLARAARDTDAALRGWEAALDRGLEARDGELRLRATLRLGDLAVLRGDTQSAVLAWQEAAQGFADLELPLREAWALTRMLQLAPNDEVERRARALFREAELAAGIASLDGATGGGLASLPWRIEACARYARERHEAQRARPPLRRPDAERPERRLEAHRVAIAASDAGVVQALGDELAALGTALERSGARSLDPEVTSFMACADLLASHKSLDAANHLLARLNAQNLPEIPLASLKGSITRSPNALVVDGLLERIEKPDDPRVTALAAEILGWRRERAAVAPLRALLAPENSRPVRRAAVVALGRIGDITVTDELVPLMDELAEEVAIALLLLGDRRGVDLHAQALAAGDDKLARSPGEIVGRYGGPAYMLLLVNSAGGAGPRALGALQGLGYLGSANHRVIDRLIGALEDRDRRLAGVACTALEIITGHREDPEEPGVQARWCRWWEDHGHHFRDGVRYRNGQPHSAALLVDRLAHDDVLVRRSSYDELVITTGESLPFDADGPWRVQVAHLAGWRAWCERTRPDAGTWTFDGHPIG